MRTLLLAVLIVSCAILLTLSFFNYLLFFEKENPFQRKATNSSQTVETVNSSNIEILGLTKTIRIRLGLLKGVKKIAFGKPLSAFLGIPYGQPPLNDLRFKHSLPAKRWSGILEARSFGPSCVQSIIRDRKGQVYLPGLPSASDNMSEDCLFINVWTPIDMDSIDSKNDKLKSVMLFIYGGAFFVGTASSSDFDGTLLASLGDVVVVTFNYRVGSLGFLTTFTPEAPGNQGLHDQALALEWVKANIVHFGGDPNEITIFGHSAGGISTGVHMIAPRTKNLFKRAILQSGATAMGNLIFETNGLEECRKLAKLVGCYNETEINFEYLDNSANSTDQDYTSFESDIDVMNCLKRVDTKKIIEAEKEIVLDENRFMAFLPRIIENDSIAVKNPNDAYKNQSNIGEEIKEVLLGVVEDEGGMFLNSIMPLVFGDTVPQNMTVDDAKMYIKKALTWVPDPGPDLVIRLLFDENQPQEKLLKQIINVIGGVTLSCPVVLFGEQFGAFEPERKAYFYNFDYKPSNFTTWPPWFGIGHTSDLFYLFGKPFRNDQKYTEDDIKVAKDVIKIWTTFAKTGKPVLPHNVAGKKWPLYGETHPNYIPINPIKASIKSGPPKNGLCDKLRVSTIL